MKDRVGVSSAPGGSFFSNAPAGSALTTGGGQRKAFELSMIYWDYNAGAPLLPDLVQPLTSALLASGNPSSVHRAGRTARKTLDSARETVASVFGCMPREVAFTGSGSEAAAIAVLGSFGARKDRQRRRVVTSSVEHPCVLGAVERLEREGAEVVRVAPEANGLVSAEKVISALNDDTALCTLMAVNNETGVVQPAGEVARACVARRIVFHCDAVQAVGKVPSTLRDVPADLLSFSAHKLGGPAGVGVLLSRRGLDVLGLTPGHQENGRRGGTQNVALAQALALALRETVDHAETEATRLGALRDRFEREVRERLPRVTVNGAGAPRVANTSNLQFEGVDGEALLIALDLDGICVSSGAACASGSLTPSHVLTAMGLTSTEAQASLRFSLGRGTTEAEVDAVVGALVRHVPTLRAASAHFGR